MARYYCDYCDARCSNNSSSVRTQHNNGNLHRRNVSAFYSQFIGKDVQDKVDAIVVAFEAKVARGEVVPTYATFPRPVIASRAEKAKDAETGGDDERPANKRPRVEAGVEETAAPESGPEGSGGGDAAQKEDSNAIPTPGTEDATEKDAVGHGSSRSDENDDDGDKPDAAKKRRKLDGDELKNDDTQGSAKPETPSDAAPAAGIDTRALSSLPSAVEDKDQTPPEGVVDQLKSEAVREAGDNADDGSDMDMDG